MYKIDDHVSLCRCWYHV
ncbi:BnaA02g11170D [Brassica napus]|uniref:BnaA02g11170D protein n=1 Tax=Brassica napus TaxID=3708 RepID=A0A078GPI0_BRANA|nr:BnaA02g11170D [Brassica napus]